MKITLDIPDTTICAFFNYVLVNEDTHGMTMSVIGLNSDDLVDGSEIKVVPYKGGDTT